MDTSDETRGPLFASPSGVRKRSRNEAEWEKNVAKRRRNLGLAYTSHTTKKAVSGRTIGQACKCSKKCFDIVGYENIQQLFKDFWDTGDWDMQTAYLQKQTSISAVKRRRTNNPRLSETTHVCTMLRWLASPCRFVRRPLQVYMV